MFILEALVGGLLSPTVIFQVSNDADSVDEHGWAIKFNPVVIC